MPAPKTGVAFAKRGCKFELSDALRDKFDHYGKVEEDRCDGK